MMISPEILNELKNISSVLAGMEKINVFQAPYGYFDELHQRISDFAILNNTSAVDNITKRNLQQVPENYFNTLSDSILTKVKSTYIKTNDEELSSMSPVLLSLKSKNVFSIPDNYFDTINDSIIFSIKKLGKDNFQEELANLSPLLFSLKNKNVFTVPHNYFEVTSSAILAKLKNNNIDNSDEELKTLSPLLRSLKKENVFSFPDNYFESFADNVYKTLTPQSAKVVTINSKKSWWKYAAAAIVTGVIAVSSLLVFNTSSPKNSNVTAALPDYIKTSFQYKTEDDLNAGIAKLSDADIIKYLEKNGNAMDNELLINNTDVSEMPSQSDYLTDENTLNEYLDKIDAESDNKTNP